MFVPCSADTLVPDSLCSSWFVGALVPWLGFLHPFVRLSLYSVSERFFNSLLQILFLLLLAQMFCIQCMYFESLRGGPGVPRWPAVPLDSTGFRWFNNTSGLSNFLSRVLKLIISLIVTKSDFTCMGTIMPSAFKFQLHWPHWHIGAAGAVVQSVCGGPGAMAWLAVPLMRSLPF